MCLLLLRPELRFSNLRVATSVESWKAHLKHFVNMNLVEEYLGSIYPLKPYS